MKNLIKTLTLATCMCMLFLTSCDENEEPEILESTTDSAFQLIKFFVSNCEVLQSKVDNQIPLTPEEEEQYVLCNAVDQDARRIQTDNLEEIPPRGCTDNSQTCFPIDLLLIQILTHPDANIQVTYTQNGVTVGQTGQTPVILDSEEKLYPIEWNNPVQGEDMKMEISIQDNLGNMAFEQKGHFGD